MNRDLARLIRFADGTLEEVGAALSMVEGNEGLMVPGLSLEVQAQVVDSVVGEMASLLQDIINKKCEAVEDDAIIAFVKLLNNRILFSARERTTDVELILFAAIRRRGEQSTESFRRKTEGRLKEMEARIGSLGQRDKLERLLMTKEAAFSRLIDSQAPGYLKQLGFMGLFEACPYGIIGQFLELEGMMDALLDEENVAELFEKDRVIKEQFRALLAEAGFESSEELDDLSSAIAALASLDSFVGGFSRLAREEPYDYLDVAGTEVLLEEAALEAPNIHLNSFQINLMKLVLPFTLLQLAARMKKLWTSREITLFIGAEEGKLNEASAPNRAKKRKGGSTFEGLLLCYLSNLEAAVFGEIPPHLSPMAISFEVTKMMYLAAGLANKRNLTGDALERQELAILEAEERADALARELMPKEFEVNTSPVRIRLEGDGLAVRDVFLASKESTPETGQAGMSVLIFQLALNIKEKGYTTSRNFMGMGEKVFPLSLALNRVTGEFVMLGGSAFSLKDVFALYGVEGEYQKLRLALLEAFHGAMKAGHIKEADPLEVKRKQRRAEEDAAVALSKENFEMPTYTGLQFSSQFETDWNRLPRQMRARAYAMFELYLEDDRHPSLHNERLNHPTRSLHSLRVNRGYRAIYEFIGEGEARSVQFIGIGPHDIYNRYN